MHSLPSSYRRLPKKPATLSFQTWIKNFAFVTQRGFSQCVFFVELGRFGCVYDFNVGAAVNARII